MITEIQSKQHVEEVCRQAPLWAYLVAYVIPYLALATVALYWPAKSGVFGIDFSDAWLARAVPSISAYVDKSPFPAATAAYFVLSAFLFAPYLLLAKKYPALIFISVNQMRASIQKVAGRSMIINILANLFFGAGIWVFWAQPGYQFGLLPINESRWALAIGGPIFSFYFFLYFISAGLYINLKFALMPRQGGSPVTGA